MLLCRLQALPNSIQIAVGHVHRAAYHQKLVTSAFRAIQHVIQAGTFKVRPQALYHLLNVHGLVEIAVGRIRAVEVQLVRTG